MLSRTGTGESRTHSLQPARQPFVQDTSGGRDRSDVVAGEKILGTIFVRVSGIKTRSVSALG